jgi:hypothetical protein
MTPVMNDLPVRRIVTHILCVAVAALLVGCATHRAPTAASPASKPPTAAAAPVGASTTSPASPTPPSTPLTGRVSRRALEDYETWKTLRAQDYTPDAAALRTIGDHARDVDVLLILATWCPDSKREVPRFFKIYDQSGLDLAGRVTMVAVDRTKKDAEGLAQRHDVQRVPTFVFLRAGKELGRVVERATTTLEGDVAAIIVK